MSPTPEQQSAVERLYENEAIIDNLTADLAQPILEWAEQQILAGANAEAVSAAVGTANQSGAQDPAAALAAAQQALAPTTNKVPAAEPPVVPEPVSRHLLASHLPLCQRQSRNPARWRLNRQCQRRIRRYRPPAPRVRTIHRRQVILNPIIRKLVILNTRKTHRTFLHRLVGWLKSYRM